MEITTLASLTEHYRLTVQESREVQESARDLEMWQAGSLIDLWEEESRALTSRSQRAKRPALSGRALKKEILRGVRARIDNLRSEKAYPASRTLTGPPRRQMPLKESSAPRKVFGRCPVYSDRTACCGLYTIDAVLGCAFNCSYCTVQTFYPDHAEKPDDLAQRLADIELDPARFYHIGTGQASDSLIWGNRENILTCLVDFAENNPNIILELKTKSDNIAPLLRLQTIPSNVVCSWSLNTDTVIRNEEHGTATLERRISAARKAADAGLRIAFHFHPMVHYDGSIEEYASLAQTLVSTFDNQEVAFASMGTLTFIRPVMKEIRRRGGETRILQMPFERDPHGKLTYPRDIKVALYRAVYQALAPWHQNVFLYLCMDRVELWHRVFGRAFDNNQAFEAAFAEAVHPEFAPKFPADCKST